MACGDDAADPWIWVVVVLILLVTAAGTVAFQHRKLLVRQLQPQLPIFDDDQVRVVVDGVSRGVCILQS